MALPSKKIVSESLTMMTTAFGLVAALAWNEAIRALINNFFSKGQGIISLFIYAILVTVIAVVVSTRLIKIKTRFDEQENGSQPH